MSKKRIRVRAYQKASASAKALSNELRGLRLKQENSKYKYRKGDVIINWGCSVPDPYGIPMINPPTVLSQTTNKRSFFQLVEQKGLSSLVPPFTTDSGEAQSWVKDGNIAVCRTVLQGHSGEGIVLFSPEDVEKGLDIPFARLYTMYIPKKREYRVHISRVSGVFDLQRKIKNPDHPIEETDFKIRNHSNGFIYVRSEGDNPSPLERIPAVINAATKIFDATGLDFGAVDVIYNEKKGEAFVLEVNTSPGLEGTTLENYVGMFKKDFVC